MPPASASRARSPSCAATFWPSMPAGAPPSCWPAASAAIAWLTVALVVPARQPPARPAGQQPALFDFRPVLRNRSAMAYALGLLRPHARNECAARLGRGFPGYVAARTGAAEGAFSPDARRHRARADRHVRERGRQRGRHPPRPPPPRLHRHGPLDCVRARSWALSARCPTPSPWRSSCCTARGLARLLVAHGRRRGHGRTVAARRDARRAFHAWLCGRLRWSARCRLDPRSRGRHVAYRVGIGVPVVAVLMVLALATFVIIRPRELAGDRGS